MKKALAILMALAMVATAAFAEDAATYGNNATVAVSGNATLTWGIDLENDGNTGFKNGTEWKVEIPILAKQSFTKAGEGSYAEIQIKEAQYYLTDKHDNKNFGTGDKKVDSVNAKLVFGKVYVTIAGSPDFSPNNVELFKPIKNDDYFADNHEGKLLRFEPGFGDGIDGYGTKIGYKDEKFDVGVKLASKWAYDNDKYYQDADEDGKTDGTFNVLGTEKSKYAVGFDAEVTPMDMLTVAGTFNYATWKRTTTADKKGEFADGIMTVGAKAVAKPIEGLEITAALDGTNDAVVADKKGKLSDIFAMEGSVSAKYKFVEAGLYYASAATPYTTKQLATDGAKVKTAPAEVEVPEDGDFDGDGDSDDDDITAIAEAEIAAAADFAAAQSWFGAFNKDDVNIGDIAAYVKLTDGDFVENLDAWFTFMMYNPSNAWAEIRNDVDGKKVGASAPIMIGLGANYKYAMNDVNYVKPFFELYGQNNIAVYKDSDSNKADSVAMFYTVNDKGKVVKGAFQTALSLGVDYGLFSNAVLTAKFQAGDTVKDHGIRMLSDTMATDKGDFTLACKVTY